MVEFEPQVNTVVSMGPLLMLATFALGVVVLLATLAWKGRWGWLALCTLLLLGAPAMLIGFVAGSARTASYQPHSPAVATAGPSLIATPQPPAAPAVGSPDLGLARVAVRRESGERASGEAASDVLADLEATGVARPRIELDDATEAPSAEADAADAESNGDNQPTGEEPVDEKTADEDTALADDEPAEELTVQSTEPSERPAWVEKPSGWSQTVLSVGPFTTRQAADEAARERTREWVIEQARDLVGGSREPVVRFEAFESSVIDRYAETRETSVGEVYLVYTLIEIDEPTRRTIREETALMVDRRQRQDFVQDTAVIGGGVLVLLAVVHLVLRRGAASDG